METRQSNGSSLVKQLPHQIIFNATSYLPCAKKKKKEITIVFILPSTNVKVNHTEPCYTTSGSEARAGGVVLRYQHAEERGSTWEVSTPGPAHALQHQQEGSTKRNS